MRGTRWLLLVAIAAILGGIGYRYRTQRKILESERPPAPPPLESEINAKSQDWHIRETDHATGRTLYDIAAREFRQIAADSHVELEGVTMMLYSKDDSTYNLVKSAAATYNANDRSLYSQGATEITIGVPVEGQPQKQLTVIKTSGVTFDSTSGRADTDQPSTFSFDRGEGAATGASYDPNAHTLEMKRDVVIHWKPTRPGAPPALIEATGLSYHETNSEIWLKPSGKVTRGNTVIEGNDAVVSLEDQQIRKLTAVQAHGSEETPGRVLRYAADELEVDFDDDGVARKVTGNRNADLTSTSASAETNVKAGHVELALEPEGHESLLRQIQANGDAVVTSKPLPAAGRQLSETHVLRSDSLEMKMRPDGREIESLVTKSPGVLEFIPNLPVQHHRTLAGKDFVIAYGPQNRIDNFHANDVRTTTDPTAEEKRRNRAVSVTTSRTIEARFDPHTNRVSTIRQAGDFTYAESDRKAAAANATMDSDQNVILLDTAARMSDSTGATIADRIRLDQRTGDFTAEGNVASTRLPDKDQKQNSAILSGDDPIQATAHKMDSRNHNRSIRYQGGAAMWQGANRIQAATIDVDREKRSVIADRDVVTDLWETPKDDPKAPKKPAAPPVLTETHAAHMVYTDPDRLAHYTGGVLLTRPDLQVKSKEVKAYLSESGSQSSLDKAFAEGAVEIFARSKDRTRTGTGEHAEYYPNEQKVILRGPWVKMVEQIFGAPRPNTTEGTELTWWANDARLLVTGVPAKPVDTRIIRKKKK